MPDAIVRVEGRAGRITLNRPEAMNALTWEMCSHIEAALDAWAGDGSIDLVVIDGAGDRAFCSGGDISEMYRTGKAGDFDYGRRFWADEYRMNRRIFRFPKAVAAFLHGFTMGGGVGVGCHGSHRVVCEGSQVAMPECGIGLIPDVGGSLILARAPGRCGEYLATTCARLGPADAIFAGFADCFVPRDDWPGLIAELERTGDRARIDGAAIMPPAGALAQRQADIDTLFGGDTLNDIGDALRRSETDLAQEALEAISRNAPLSMACAVELIHRVRRLDTIEAALTREFRFTWRSMARADFLEGIRAAIIDKDRSPLWRHDGPGAVSREEVDQMLAPLSEDELRWDET